MPTTTQSFRLSHRFAGISRSKVREFYTDLHRLRDIHPFIVEIEEVGLDGLKIGNKELVKLPPSAPPGSAVGKAYRITDKLQLFSFLPFTIVYETVCVEDDASADGQPLQFTVFPGSYTRMKTSYTFKEDSDGSCILEETVEVGKLAAPGSVTVSDGNIVAAAPPKKDIELIEISSDDDEGPPAKMTAQRRRAVPRDSASVPASTPTGGPVEPASIFNRGQLRFALPEICRLFVKTFPRQPSMLALEDILDAKNLLRGIVTSFDFDDHLLKSALRDASTDLHLWIGLPESEKQERPAAGVYPFSSDWKNVKIVFKNFVRVVVSSGNITKRELLNVENTMFVQDFPRTSFSPSKPAASLYSKVMKQDAWNPTFGEAVLDFLQAFGFPPEATEWISGFDYQTEAVFVGSRPVHQLPDFDRVHKYGLARLSGAVKQMGFGGRKIEVEFATSTLGALDTAWIEEVKRAAAGLRPRSASTHDTRFKILYPTLSTVQSSLAARVNTKEHLVIFEWGSEKWSKCTKDVKALFHDYESRRQLLLSHAKFMLVESEIAAPNGVYGYRFVGSQNLTKTAWGQWTKDGKLFGCLNWEAGVLVPSKLGSGGTPARRSIPTPYKRPARPYGKDDVPILRREHFPKPKSPP
ncbi:hypothetical protein DFJ74DRAFT_713684 [Hyaloraphidium curvatum]|nr:hypothetical protein DFJ74DRAFT_713684 [Hyaloraphidium curvatum]